ncbi:hypothetical protein JY462_19110 [Serratia marcescens]|uniref:hypothetical protein n=1 Tax=Serratia fonticola TaxID=47917 RepID=UPI0011CD9D77|nr:hypothetical protein [Serratia fonticola]MBN5206935.1 hypothetical protein [Serratia marcescens]
MNVQLVTVNDDEYCSDRYVERVEQKNTANGFSCGNVVSLESVKKAESYKKAKERAAAVAATLDW